MKASPPLVGDYCQACATILSEVQRKPRKLIALDPECLRVFEQSGDAARLEGTEHHAPALPTYDDQKESEKIKETVHSKAAPKRSHR